MKDNVMPEEKLLRLIRGQKKPKAAQQENTLKENRPKANVFKALSGGAVGFISGLNSRKVVIFLFVLSCLYALYAFVRPLVGLHDINIPKQARETKPFLEPKDEAKPFAFYQQGVSGRTIFAGPEILDSQSPQNAANTSADLIKDISLVGVVSGDNPQAVIEDKKAQKTYYVTKGQSIGELQVDDIQEGKIIVIYRGQRYELYL